MYVNGLAVRQTEETKRKGRQKGKGEEMGREKESEVKICS